MGQDAVAHLTLREAAETVGTSKSTLFRAIRAGRISATRDDDGQFRIDPAELFRVYPPATSERSAPARAAPQAMTQDAPAADTALAVRCASLEAEVQGLKAMVEELRRSREKWEAQAERLALAPPTPITVTMSEQRPWWRRMVG
jgi:excisionase family DNA binding protein